MNFKHDDFRIVYLRDKKKSDESRISFSYFEPLSDNDENILTKITKCKRHIEWNEILDGIKKTHFRNYDLYVIEEIRSIPPDAVLQKSEHLKKRITEDNFKNLESKAKKIVERLTIFVFPTVKHEEEYKYQIIIDNMATEVIGYLNKTFSTESDYMPFSFAIESEELKTGEINLLGSLVDALLIKVNQGSFGVLLKHIDKKGPVLLEGPTGVGKTMFARLFAYSLKKKSENTASSMSTDSRLEVPFHQLNVTGIPEGLIESRIRGTKKGVFTNVGEVKGCFEIANDGVLFLDEFQNAPEWVQTQLLDVLDPLSNNILISKLGEAEIKVWNVKVFLAVNKPVKKLLSEGKLREDLYYRIREVVPIPSLKELLDDENDIRKRDGLSPHGFLRKLIYIYRWKHPVKIDADYLYKSFPQIAVDTIDILKNEKWEGNFREFEKRIADLLWDFDKGFERTPLIIDSVDRTILSKESSVKQSTDVRNDEELILRAVESALKNNDYILKKALPELRKYRIGSYPTLRLYIRNNYDRFSIGTQSNPHIKKTAMQKYEFI